MLAPEARRRLKAVLEDGRERGMLGPGPVETHLDHGEELAAALGRDFAGRFLDLGSGGGIPGLVLLAAWPDAAGTLLEAQRRRCWFLEAAVRQAGVEARAEVACGRAEELARRADLRGAFDLVVARGFGSPATTAECAVGFLRRGGVLVVSEPPGGPDPGRWPEEGLGQLGLAGPELRAGKDARFAVLTASGPPGDRWPRREGVPARRPLW
jgi:16S rRNA (guanine527-N7)-methyltransferase